MFACALMLSVLEQIQVPCKPGAREPQLSVGADGHVALAWADRGVIRVCFGAPEDRQHFFGVHGMWTEKKLQYAVGMRRGPRLALLAKDHIVLTAIGGEKGGGNDGDLLAWRNTPDTLSWEDALHVNSVPGSAREGLQALARGAQDEVYCAWIDLRSGKPQIWGACSKDGGASWTNEAAISGEAEICPCCAPSVAFDANGRVHVMWRGLRDGARDMQIASPPGEATKLGSGTWKLDACPMDGGALALAADGRMLTVWRRDTQVFSATDGSAETLIGAGEQPWIAGSTIVWLEKRGGKLFALAANSKVPEMLAADANDPVIAASPDGKSVLYAAWETGSGDESQIQLARLAPR